MRVYNSLRKQLAPIITPENRRVLSMVGIWAAGENTSLPVPVSPAKKRKMKASDFKALMNRPK